MSKNTRFSDGTATATTRAVSTISTSVTKIESEEILLNNGILIANVSTPTPAIINIISVNGSTIRNIKLSPNKTFNEMINFKGLPAGIYVVRCTVGNRKAEQKMVIK